MSTARTPPAGRNLPRMVCACAAVSVLFWIDTFSVFTEGCRGYLHGRGNSRGLRSVGGRSIGGRSGALALPAEFCDLLAGRCVGGSVRYSQEHLLQGGHAHAVAGTRETGEKGRIGEAEGSSCHLDGHCRVGEGEVGDIIPWRTGTAFGVSLPV